MVRRYRRVMKKEDAEIYMRTANEKVNDNTIRESV